MRHCGTLLEPRFVVPGGMNKALVAARRIWSEGAQAKLNRSFYQEVPRKDQKGERGDFEREAATR